MTICYQPKGTTDISKTGSTIEDVTGVTTTILYECFNEGTIEVIYDGSAHNCEHAVYEIYANGYKLKRTNRYGNLVDYASLNNKDPKRDPLDDATMIKSAGDTKPPKAGKNARYNIGRKKRKKIKRGRKNIFHLEINGINKEFFNADIVGKHDGQLVISAKCLKTEHGKWHGGTDCHRGVGDIKMILPSMNVEDEAIGEKTPNSFREEKVLATFPACTDIIKKVTADKPKLLKRIITWFKQNRDGSKGEEIDKKIIKF